MSIEDILVRIVLPLLSILGVGTIIPMLIKERSETKKANSIEAKKKEEEKLRENLLGAIQEGVKPITEEIKELHANDELQREGIQALLRDRLAQLSSECLQKGFTTHEERDNFENMYQKYHKLGVNGVMDKSRDKFFNIPYAEEIDDGWEDAV